MRKKINDAAGHINFNDERDKCYISGQNRKRVYEQELWKEIVKFQQELTSLQSVEEEHNTRLLRLECVLKKFQKNLICTDAFKTDLKRNSNFYVNQLGKLQGEARRIKTASEKKILILQRLKKDSDIYLDSVKEEQRRHLMTMQELNGQIMSSLEKLKKFEIEDDVDSESVMVSKWYDMINTRQFDTGTVELSGEIEQVVEDSEEERTNVSLDVKDEDEENECLEQNYQAEQVCQAEQGSQLKEESQVEQAKEKSQKEQECQTDQGRRVEQGCQVEQGCKAEQRCQGYLAEGKRQVNEEVDTCQDSREPQKNRDGNFREVQSCQDYRNFHKNIERDIQVHEFREHQRRRLHQDFQKYPEYREYMKYMDRQDNQTPRTHRTSLKCRTFLDVPKCREEQKERGLKEQLTCPEEQEQQRPEGDQEQLKCQVSDKPHGVPDSQGQQKCEPSVDSEMQQKNQNELENEKWQTKRLNVVEEQKAVDVEQHKGLNLKEQKGIPNVCHEGSQSSFSEKEESTNLNLLHLEQKKYLNSLEQQIRSEYETRGRSFRSRKELRNLDLKGHEESYPKRWSSQERRKSFQEARKNRNHEEHQTDWHLRLQQKGWSGWEQQKSYENKEQQKSYENKEQQTSWNNEEQQINSFNNHKQQKVWNNQEQPKSWKNREQHGSFSNQEQQANWGIQQQRRSLSQPEQQKRVNSQEIQTSLPNQEVQKKWSSQEQQRSVGQPEQQKNWNGQEQQKSVNSQEIQTSLPDQEVQKNWSRQERQRSLSQPEQQKNWNAQDQQNSWEQQKSLNNQEQWKNCNTQVLQTNRNNQGQQKSLNCQEVLTGFNNQEQQKCWNSQEQQNDRNNMEQQKSLHNQEQQNGGNNLKQQKSFHREEQHDGWYCLEKQNNFSNTKHYYTSANPFYMKERGILEGQISVNSQKQNIYNDFINANEVKIITSDHPEPKKYQNDPESMIRVPVNEVRTFVLQDLEKVRNRNGQNHPMYIIKEEVTRIDLEFLEQSKYKEERQGSEEEQKSLDREREISISEDSQEQDNCSMDSADKEDKIEVCEKVVNCINYGDLEFDPYENMS